jgi:hypothetical protein
MVFDSTPTTFLLPANLDDVEFHDFMKRHREISKGIYYKERMPYKHCAKNMWLVKPANMN